MDVSKDRLREAIANKGTTATDLAVQIGRDRTYFRDFLTGKKKGIGAGPLAEAAKRLDVTVEWLSGQGLAKAAQQPVASQNAPPGRKMIPLFGQAVAGPEGQFPLTGDKLADLPCPPQLESVQEPYAVSISGDSMEPRMRSGSVGYVNPSRSPRKGDDVVIQVHKDGELWAYVKELVSISADKVVVLQLNPEKKITFAKADVKTIHCIQLIER